VSALRRKPATKPRKKADRGVTGRLTRKDRGERFTEYLACSIEMARPLKHERTTQRNKAIFMLVLVFVVFLWVLFKFFL
jgi:hypothetical protein